MSDSTNKVQIYLPEHGVTILASETVEKLVNNGTAYFMCGNIIAFNSDCYAEVVDIFPEEDWEDYGNPRWNGLGIRLSAEVPEKGTDIVCDYDDVRFCPVYTNLTNDELFYCVGINARGTHYLVPVENIRGDAFPKSYEEMKGSFAKLDYVRCASIAPITKGQCQLHRGHFGWHDSGDGTK